MSAAPLEAPAPVEAIKPLLRGVPDVIGVLLALPATFALVAAARPGDASLGAAIYGPSLIFLLAASTLYHLPTWSPRARTWLRRVDHMAIFVLIAGTYTPICLSAVSAPTNVFLLTLAWLIAGAGIVVALVWPAAPRWVNVGLAIGLGWLVVAFGDAVFDGLDAVELSLLGAGGLMYSSGAIAYATHRPNPIPGVFGYHEVFHTLVVSAAICHFVAVWRIVT